MINSRIKTLSLTIFLCFVIVIGRIFYWQILKYEDLNQKAINQNYRAVTRNPVKGKIYDSQGSPLALNYDFYQLSLYKPDIKSKDEDIINSINEEDKDSVRKFFANPSQKWLTTKSNYRYDQKTNFHDPGITFSPVNVRFYPESPIADTIIHGLESYYQKQLNGRVGFSWENKDAVGQTLLNHTGWYIDPVDGIDLHTSLNRQIQSIIEKTLKSGLEKYTADSGSISIISPSTGEIIAMTSFESSPSAYTKNPVISNLFEPGSIFKPLVMSMALDKNSLDLNYICEKCGSPRQIGQYTISNWDNSLHPQSSLQDIIKNSDNIGMSFVISRLGLTNFLNYFKLLKLDRKTGIDLRGEVKPLSKNFLPEIDLATASFGQGFAITQIQMLTAFNVIANDGVLVPPHLVLDRSRPAETLVFQPSTAQKMKTILKYAVENGVVAKFKPNDLEVCAKSGTAQIAVKGGYSDSATIASYIGFSPCLHPKYTMIVTINNPRTSPWGSSTAAPIWYDIASQIQPLL